ncbi:phage head-tail joining protein [Agrobacterium rosae]|uniref:phage head-tail joining protein n=1 Tax=Agrobacterium rosae TaxID=1972867 RepID=UPI003BA30E3A
MALIDDQISALEEAIAMGAKKVTFHSGGTRREVEYHSLRDMREALANLKSRQCGGSRMILAALD